MPFQWHFHGKYGWTVRSKLPFVLHSLGYMAKLERSSYFGYLTKCLFSLCYFADGEVQNEQLTRSNSNTHCRIDVLLFHTTRSRYDRKWFENASFQMWSDQVNAKQKCKKTLIFIGDLHVWLSTLVRSGYLLPYIINTIHSSTDIFWIPTVTRNANYWNVYYEVWSENALQRVCCIYMVSSVLLCLFLPNISMRQLFFMSKTIQNFSSRNSRFCVQASMEMTWAGLDWQKV